MTIGIAAAGPRAGQAILEGLKAAEAVGRGALHGFVSLVVIGQDGTLRRAETQNGGLRGLFDGGPVPEAIAAAERAGLMSSGPNRPVPLNQFTPADPNIGLVTGHRFPNVKGLNGRPLNLDVLDLMGEGFEPEAAVGRIIADNAWADAGFIALSRDGQLHAENTAYLRTFPDAGRALGQLTDGSARAAVLHNAIEPHGALAALVVEVALAAMTFPPAAVASVSFDAGVPLRAGAENALEIDEAGRVLAVIVREPRYLSGRWSMGLGYRAAVMREGRWVGRALYEPFLRISDGRIESIDGLERLDLSVDLDAKAAGASLRNNLRSEQPQFDGLISR